MSAHLTIDRVREFAQSDDWKSVFSGTIAAEGRKIARARQITQCQAELLDTGDVEIIAQIIEKSGHQYETTLALWEENGVIQLDTTCSCPTSVFCEHAAAAIEHLARPSRIEQAFGVLADEPSTATLTEKVTPTSTAPLRKRLKWHFTSTSNVDHKPTISNGSPTSTPLPTLATTATSTPSNPPAISPYHVTGQPK